MLSPIQGSIQTSAAIRSLVSPGKHISKKLSLAKMKLTNRQRVNPHTIADIKHSVEVSLETDLHPFTVSNSR
jgi:uncharacterized protein YabE (DUF348 family)